MYQHILLATDLSQVSQVIANRAKMLAEKFGAKLSVAYVLEYTPIIYGEGEFALPMDSEMLKTFEDNAKKALAQLCKDLNLVNIDQYVKVDAVKHGVVSLAKEIKADLIVVGSHSRHGMEFLLGTSANAILHAAECDVLAVRVFKS